MNNSEKDRKYKKKINYLKFDLVTSIEGVCGQIRKIDMMREQENLDSIEHYFFSKLSAMNKELMEKINELKDQ